MYINVNTCICVQVCVIYCQCFIHVVYIPHFMLLYWVLRAVLANLWLLWEGCSGCIIAWLSFVVHLPQQCGNLTVLCGPFTTTMWEPHCLLLSIYRNNVGTSLSFVVHLSQQCGNLTVFCGPFTTPMWEPHCLLWSIYHNNVWTSLSFVVHLTQQCGDLTVFCGPFNTTMWGPHCLLLSIYHNNVGTWWF